MPLKPEDRSAMCTASGSWPLDLLTTVSEWVAGLVRRRASPPEPSMRASLDQATRGLESLQVGFDASLRDLDAAYWDDLSQRLDRVNELLRSVVDEIAGRQQPPD
jgi:hypothetical protein